MAPCSLVACTWGQPGMTVPSTDLGRVPTLPGPLSFLLSCAPARVRTGDTRLVGGPTLADSTEDLQPTLAGTTMSSVRRRAKYFYYEPRSIFPEGRLVQLKCDTQVTYLRPR